MRTNFEQLGGLWSAQGEEKMGLRSKNRGQWWATVGEKLGGQKEEMGLWEDVGQWTEKKYADVINNSLSRLSGTCCTICQICSTTK